MCCNISKDHALPFLTNKCAQPETQPLASDEPSACCLTDTSYKVENALHCLVAINPSIMQFFRWQLVGIITWAIDSRRVAITYVNIFTMFNIIGIRFEKDNKFESKTILMMGLASTIGMSQKALKNTFGRNNWSPTTTVRVWYIIWFDFAKRRKLV